MMSGLLRGISLAAAAALAAGTAAFAQDASQGVQAEEPRWALVIHGGAGVIRRDAMTEEQELAYARALTRAVTTPWRPSSGRWRTTPCSTRAGVR